MSSIVPPTTNDHCNTTLSGQWGQAYIYRAALRQSSRLSHPSRAKHKLNHRCQTSWPPEHTLSVKAPCDYCGTTRLCYHSRHTLYTQARGMLNTAFARGDRRIELQHHPSVFGARETCVTQMLLILLSNFACVVLLATQARPSNPRHMLCRFQMLIEGIKISAVPPKMQN